VRRAAAAAVALVAGVAAWVALMPGTAARALAPTAGRLDVAALAPVPPAEVGQRPARAAAARRRADARGASPRAVPILMYHHVAAAPRRRPRNPLLWVPPPLFARQVAALARAGFRGVTMAQVWRHWLEVLDLAARRA
jgi:hypothetical protein